MYSPRDSTISSQRSSRRGLRRSFRGSTKSADRESKALDLFEKFKNPYVRSNSYVKLTDLYENLLAGGIDIFKDERTEAVVKTLPPYACKLSIDNIRLDQAAFLSFMNAGHDFIVQCLEKKLVIGDFNFLRKIIGVIGQRCVDGPNDFMCKEIPHLSQQDPNVWGISICSADGQICGSDSSKATFTLQDACKPFIYALALELFGAEEVDSYVGFQLTSLSPFAKIPPKSKTVNPMMETGVILLCSMISNRGLGGMSLAAKLDYITAFFKKLCGARHVSYNKSMLMSLMSNSHSFMAVAYFMESAKYFDWEHDIEQDMEFYFQMRSVEMSCESLSALGAGLANGGVNPFTGERALSPLTCRRLFSCMQFLSSASLAPYFTRLVCLPMIFSISGLCLLILPSQLSLCMFSPKLGEKLKVSSKPLQFVTQLEEELSVHPFGTHKGKSNVLQPPATRCKNNCIINYEIRKGDFINMVKHLDDSKVLHSTDYLGKNLLHVAAASGHITCVKYLHKECPLLIKQKDVKGWLPKDYARHFQHEDVFTFLDENGLK